MNASRVVVVDASLATKWSVNEEGTGTAIALLERWADRETIISLG